MAKLGATLDAVGGMSTGDRKLERLTEWMLGALLVLGFGCVLVGVVTLRADVAIPGALASLLVLLVLASSTLKNPRVGEQRVSDERCTSTRLAAAERVVGAANRWREAHRIFGEALNDYSHDLGPAATALNNARDDLCAALDAVGEKPE